MKTIYKLSNAALDRDIESGVLVKRYNDEVLAKQAATIEAERSEVLAYLSAKGAFKAASSGANAPASSAAAVPAAPAAKNP